MSYHGTHKQGPSASATPKRSVVTPREEGLNVREGAILALPVRLKRSFAIGGANGNCL